MHVSAAQRQGIESRRFIFERQRVAKEGTAAMSEQQTILMRLIIHEVRSRDRDASIADAIFDVLSRSGIDTRLHPTAEEMKSILVSAYRAQGMEACYGNA